MRFFSLGKAAQGFSVPAHGTGRSTIGTPQPETRGEQSPAGKRPFMGGHLKVNVISFNLAQKGRMTDFKNPGGFRPVAVCCL